MHLGIILSLHREILGYSFEPALITTALKDTEIAPAIKDTARCRVITNHSTNSIVINSRWKTIPTNLGNTLTFNTLVESSNNLLKTFEKSIGIAGRVRNVLRSLVEKEYTMESVSEILGMTPRTLRRALRAEGTSYRDISDEFTRQLALKYLHETDRTVEDIAFAIGFKDTANFRRSLRRLTGKTPTQLRERTIM